VEVVEDRAGELKRAIVSRALELGFSKVGFAKARVEKEAPRLAQWLDNGHHGEMGWMARAPERRWNAERSLPGTATVVCCTLNYYQGAPIPPEGLAGVISSYARGHDYHEVMQSKLRILATFIESLSGAVTRVYVDTGPLLEKSFAAEAGLGWVGKHSNLLSRDGSSWFFLGEILVPLHLPVDSPTPNHCGSCSRCIEACPTKAIVQPYDVDSRLCISYLTIELRGPIPRELRASVGRRIYGCDDCQDVCPWNRFARKSDERAFFPREPLASMDLVDLLRMSREAFLDATRGSAIRRSRYAGFLRNVAVALGNSHDARAVPALVEALTHEEALVRGHAAWALGAIGSRDAKESMKSRLGVEKDEWVREEIELALNGLSPLPKGEGKDSYRGSMPTS
jgi:epoxyqueuosine reductase